MSKQITLAEMRRIELTEAQCANLEYMMDRKFEMDYIQSLKNVDDIARYMEERRDDFFISQL